MYNDNARKSPFHERLRKRRRSVAAPVAPQPAPPAFRIGAEEFLIFGQALPVALRLSEEQGGAPVPVVHIATGRVQEVKVGGLY